MKDNNYGNFFDMLKVKSTAQYLRATAFSRADGVDFDGLISEKMFFNEFYFNTDKAEKLKREILENINDSALRLNLLIGYSGCGKTTFMHYLLREKEHTRYIFDMEIGIDNQRKDPILIKISNELENIIMDDIIEGGKIFHLMYEVFFSQDYNIFKQVITYIDLDRTINKLMIDYFEDKMFDNILACIHFGKEKSKIDLSILIHTYLEKMQPLQLLGLYVLWNITEEIEYYRIHNEVSQNFGCVFCFDNLDNIDSVDKTKEFIKYTAEAWIGITTFFKMIELDKYKISSSMLLEKYAIVLAMRETTYAKLTEHFNENSKRIIEEFQISEIYSKKNIISKRMDFLKENRDMISDNLYQDVETINMLMSNSYIERNVFSLFNNSYNTAVSTLTLIASQNSVLLNEYKEISAMKNRRFYKGANGIILRLLFDYFKQKRYFDEKYLNLLNFGNEEKYLFSPARLILTYLNNCRDEVCLYDIFRYFEGILDAEDVADIIDKIYLLRFTDWRHLLTFNKYPPRDDNGLKSQLDLYRSGRPITECREEYAKLEITCAGRMYLNTMSTNYEFFASRLFGDNYKPLFSRDNLLSERGRYRFMYQIEGVIKAVEGCCSRMGQADKEICEKKGWSVQDLYKSKLTFENYQRDLSVSSKLESVRQFHTERIIFSHLGYINMYRQYVLQKCVKDDEDKAIELNRILTQYIKEYLMLYKKLDIKSEVNQKVAIELEEQIQVIINSGFTDFITPIETTKYRKQFEK